MAFPSETGGLISRKIVLVNNHDQQAQEAQTNSTEGQQPVHLWLLPQPTQILNSHPGHSLVISIQYSTRGFQIDYTMRKIFARLENNIDIGSRATEMCPNIKAIDVWLLTLENLYFTKCCFHFPAV